jgi:3-oxoacyl-[acyl-carrier-protein] synthase III/NAD(P)-dependent dehydrogenase (short-subunit alcohol dehydrogenase family)
MKSYIFLGIGHSTGKYTITNEYIADAIRKGLLRGFDENRMAKSKNYLAYKSKNPDIGAFDYFVREKMGFNIRKHITPFPPTKKKLYYAESSLELGVRAVEDALKDAGTSPEMIDAWFVSTVSPNQKAPGIAASIKSHFVGFKNYKPTFTITSGCSGFNTNLQRAIEYLQTHDEATNVVVAHTETMSSFLTQRVKFVPFVTFGDGAAAVILSKKETEKQQGVIAINNYQDMQMVDFVGVDNDWNLHMDDIIIKDRAVNNIPIVTKEVMSQSKWSVDDLDLCIPHQTGNAILYPSAKELNLKPEQLCLDGQKEFGNVSGATVPITYSLLNKQNRLTAGMKIVSPMAGVGGNFGAFTYLVPSDKYKNKKINYLFENNLKGTTALILGASGTLGSEIAKDLIRRGAEVILHYFENEDIINDIINLASSKNIPAKAYKSDFNDEKDIVKFIDNINKEHKIINFFINAVGVLVSKDDNKISNVNYYTPLRVFKSIFPKLKGTAMFVGAAVEDNSVAEIHKYTSAKRSLHGVLASMSGEILKSGNYLVWYIPGILNGGMLRNIDEKALYKFAIEIGQSKHLDVKDTAFRIVSSLYIPKVEGTNNNYENAMLIRRDGYQLEVDI